MGRFFGRLEQFMMGVKVVQEIMDRAGGQNCWGPPTEPSHVHG